MIFDNNQVCPTCGQKAAKQASFCPACGGRLAGGTRICGVCASENNSSAAYCKQCGSPLSQSEAPQVYAHRWARGAEDFAVRIEADDLSGLLKRGIKVEPGTNALIIERGAVKATVPPGAYNLGNIGQRVADWFTGDIPERVTILMVDVTPTDLDFALGGRFTKDEMPIGMRVRVQVEVEDPGKFLINLLKGRERFSKNDVLEYLYPEINQVADNWLRAHTLQELTEDPRQKGRLELGLEEDLKTTFGQTGLRFLQARAVELNLEPYEDLKRKRAKYSLLVADTQVEADGQRKVYDVKTGAEISQAEAELKAKARFAEIAHLVDLQNLAEEGHKVELEERKAELYTRMRKAVMSDKMDEVRSTEEFEAFLDNIDRGKLLRSKERQDLLRVWEEEKEDHNRARARLQAKLDVEQDYELRLAALKLQGDYDRQKLDLEMDIARKRADFEFEQRRKTADEELRLEQERTRIAIERSRVQLEIDQLKWQQEHAQEKEEVTFAMELLSKMKEIKRLDKEENLRIERVHELERMRGLQQLELEKMEFQERQRAAEREYELKRIHELSTLSVEALISISSHEQGQILASLKRTETLKGMSEEQILAMAAEHSPEVARAFQERYRAIAEGKVNEREVAMYNQLLAEKDASLQRLQESAEKRSKDVTEAWEKSSARIQDIAEKALNSTSETARAFAQGQGNTPIVIMPSGGGPQVIHPGKSEPEHHHQPTETKMCPTCGRFVSTEARHCEHCGHKFEGVS